MSAVDLLSYKEMNAGEQRNEKLNHNFAKMHMLSWMYRVIINVRNQSLGYDQIISLSYMQKSTSIIVWVTIRLTTCKT